MRILRSGLLPALLTCLLAVLAGCGAGPVTARSTNAYFSLSPGSAVIDTNCTGCNTHNAHGSPIDQFTATSSDGGAAPVAWSVSGGDRVAGPGTITSTGQYTPPSYLTADRVQVMVTASLVGNPAVKASSLLTVTPGFLQPLTPENVALGTNGAITVTGYLAEAGGTGGISFALADTPTGESGGQGTLSTPNCERSEKAFTQCTVTYTAPAAISSTGVTFLVAMAGAASKTHLEVLLNTAGVASNPAGHQGEFPGPAMLGSSGGNNNDFDLTGNTVVDCCSGTLGSLIQDASGRQYLLSNNHVLARSDQAGVGDAIVQPGLIDNNCTPSGDGAGTVPVGALTGWLSLGSGQTNADAAIAQVDSHAVDPSGSILELGTRQADGTLSAAPPGISSTGGKGETASLDLRIAKSGRTTGLTCGGVSAVGLDISVDYFRDCAETKPYLTKVFTNQVGVSGNRFSDAGDSGALIVDAENAEPVGLYFAGGDDLSGVGQGVANPVADVLSELSSQVGNGTTYTFVGASDHPVSCLSYGDSTIAAAQARPLSDEEISRAQQTLTAARQLVNPSAGVLGVALGKSSDDPGKAAILFYINAVQQPLVPQTVDGVRTQVIATDAKAVAMGSAPTANSLAASALPAGVLAQALSLKQRVAHGWMQKNPAFFGIGVGQSLDNPREAALIIYVDRNRIPSALPQAIDGLRTRYILMDRLHVTRSFAMPSASTGHCMPHAAPSADFNDSLPPRSLPLF
ncbi:MAG TPA: hypothetical protein VKR31_02895 [Rhizomicrobium sp.]|nr:hypothetical protein [Rhizomicrobium sp.]